MVCCRLFFSGVCGSDKRQKGFYLENVGIRICVLKFDMTPAFPDVDLAKHILARNSTEQLLLQTVEINCLMSFHVLRIMLHFFRARPMYLISLDIHLYFVVKYLAFLLATGR